jgi:hypothetical protein
MGSEGAVTPIRTCADSDVPSDPFESLSHIEVLFHKRLRGVRRENEEILIENEEVRSAGILHADR